MRQWLLHYGRLGKATILRLGIPKIDLVTFVHVYRYLESRISLNAIFLTKFCIFCTINLELDFVVAILCLCEFDGLGISELLMRNAYFVFQFSCCFLILRCQGFAMSTLNSINLQKSLYPRSEKFSKDQRILSHRIIEICARQFKDITRCLDGREKRQ